jgi:tRNA-modifying protein YgfZ
MHVEEAQVRAFDEGGVFVDLSAYRKVGVSGADAVGWLHDLLTADIAPLSPGTARRSLLLTPTGRIRADVHVMRRDEDLLLVQSPDQPEHIGLLLNPYTLSSDVLLEDVTNSLSLLAVPGPGAAHVGRPGSTPSVLGRGVDLVTPSGKPTWRLVDALVHAGLSEARTDAVEAWRIGRGDIRPFTDAGTDVLPAEAGLEHLVAWDKGCFLGQESVAKVRNLGHPARVVRRVAAEGEVAPGVPVLAGAETAGKVTSAATVAGRSTAFVLLRWDARDAPLALPDGRALVRVPNGA